MATKYGTYYSVLIELKYWNAIQFCVNDPMHNLFLGTAKFLQLGLIISHNRRKVKGYGFADRYRPNANQNIEPLWLFHSRWMEELDFCFFSLYFLCGILLEHDYSCSERICACLPNSLQTYVDYQWYCKGWYVVNEFL